MYIIIRLFELSGLLFIVSSNSPKRGKNPTKRKEVPPQLAQHCTAGGQRASTQLPTPIHRELGGLEPRDVRGKTKSVILKRGILGRGVPQHKVVNCCPQKWNNSGKLEHSGSGGNAEESSSEKRRQDGCCCCGGGGGESLQALHPRASHFLSHSGEGGSDMCHDQFEATT